MTRRFALALLACFIALSCVASDLRAQARYPERGIELIITWAPGGYTDITGRIFAIELARALGVPVTPVNKPGASGTIGAAYVHNAKKDGYTVLYGSTGNEIGSILIDNVPYNFTKDFVPLTVVAATPYGIFVKADSPIRTLRELLDRARKAPKSVAMGAATRGDAHFNLLILQKAAGVEFNFVPFRGGGESVPAVLGGHVDAATTGYASLVPSIKADSLRVLAVTGKSRVKEAPEAPTLREEGFGQTFIDYGWNGVFVPTGVPQHVIDTLRAASEKAIQSRELVANIEKTGNAVQYMTTAEFQKMVRAESDVIEALARDLRIKDKK